MLGDLGRAPARLRGLDAGLGETVWTFVVLGIGFVIACVVALFGYGFVARLQLVLEHPERAARRRSHRPDLPRLDLDAALGVPDGSWILVIGGAVVVFSFVGLAWVQSSSDIARYQRPASSARSRCCGPPSARRSRRSP